MLGFIWYRVIIIILLILIILILILILIIVIIVIIISKGNGRLPEFYPCMASIAAPPFRFPPYPSSVGFRTFPLALGFISPTSAIVSGWCLTRTQEGMVVGDDEFFPTSKYITMIYNITFWVDQIAEPNIEHLPPVVRVDHLGLCIMIRLVRRINFCHIVTSQI